MGPIAAVWARELRARGHDVSVVTAQPHYPAELFRQRAGPLREVREGVPVLRLPLLIGHRTAARRIAEEATYAASVGAALPFLAPVDAAVVVSPSFLALGPILVDARLRGTPWILWLQDILPDAAVATGLMGTSRSMRLASALERAAYRAADRIVVISESHRRNLLAKGVPGDKVTLVRNPATHSAETPREAGGLPARVLYMGNSGYSQGLAEHVRALCGSSLDSAEVRLTIVGHGELMAAVRAEAREPLVEVLGHVSAERLDRELSRAALGLVTQRPGIAEFNLPSRLMNFLIRGIPVLASVAPDSELARVVRDSGAGWVVDNARLDAFPQALSAALSDRAELERRGAAARAFAREQFSAEGFAERFEAVVEAARADRL